MPFPHSFRFGAARVRAVVCLLLLAVLSCAREPPRSLEGIAPRPPTHSLQGIASWYGYPHHGRETASGRRFNMYALTAAHRTFPLGTRVRVTNLMNARWVIVTITDRGPFSNGRIIDLSYAAAKRIGLIGLGTAPVQLEVLKQ